MKLLVIGYGNELRGDDAIGPRVARAVTGCPGLVALATHGLSPELAEPMSRAERVLFVDASLTAGEVELEELTVDSRVPLGHTSDPRHLLALSEMLYGRRPPAWRVLVPAEKFEFGTAPSPRAELGIQLATKTIKNMVQ